MNQKIISSIKTIKCKKRLVFRIGESAGFFSEYNNMVLAIIYCLKNNIEFELYSSHSNFLYKHGWNDYFQPFCKENRRKFHSKYNYRPYNGFFIYPLERKIVNFFVPQFQINAYYPLYFRIQRKLGFSPHLTQELFAEIRNQSTTETISLPEHNLKGNLREICKTITDMTWHFNEDTLKHIESTISSLELPSEYIGFHIRGGDKITEVDLIHPSEYITRAEKTTTIRNAFVLTDDYKIIEYIRENHKNWNIWTLCRPDERGYFNEEHHQQDKDTIKNEQLKLLTSVTILERAHCFMGTYSSNIGMFLGMRLPSTQCIGLDRDEWYIC